MLDIPTSFSLFQYFKEYTPQPCTSFLTKTIYESLTFSPLLPIFVIFPSLEKRFLLIVALGNSPAYLVQVLVLHAFWVAVFLPFLGSVRFVYWPVELQLDLCLCTEEQLIASDVRHIQQHKAYTRRWNLQLPMITQNPASSIFAC